LGKTKAERDAKRAEKEAELVEKQLERERLAREKAEAEDANRKKEKSFFKGMMKVVTRPPPNSLGETLLLFYFSSPRACRFRPPLSKQSARTQQ